MSSSEMMVMSALCVIGALGGASVMNMGAMVWKWLRR
jgi:hypothetical protein